MNKPRVSLVLDLDDLEALVVALRYKAHSDSPPTGLPYAWRHTPEWRLSERLEERIVRKRTGGLG